MKIYADIDKGDNADYAQDADDGLVKIQCWHRWEDMGLHESAEMLIYRSLIPEKKKNAELQVFLLPVTLFIGKREKKR